MQAPVMLPVTILAAAWVVRRFAVAPTWLQNTAVGLLGLALLLAAELWVALPLRGRTFARYVAGQDPVSGAVYLALLAVDAVMPLLFALRRRKRRH